MSYTFFNNVVKSLENQIELVADPVVDLGLRILIIIDLSLQILNLEFKALISYEFIINFL